ncbi:cytochrome c oxidase subunit 3 [Echinicola rosea]|uniref:cytochrome c oxidase subunit 3 n=1 Tax=Echinicola rosea TaxID=1807691 RepID=UPI0010CA63B9|nr:cytochrome c oxidase subunit 3 [Echinicola rosea]
MKRDASPGLIKKIEQLHPYQLLVYLGMAGSGIVFLFLAVAFLLTFIQDDSLKAHHLPWPFWGSTAVLLSGNFWTWRLGRYLKIDAPWLLKKALWSVLLVGLFFIGFQVWGWIVLGRQGVEFSGVPSGSYLYVLTGIHIMHLLGAMIFVLMMIYEVHQVVVNPIKELVFSNNPYVGMRIRLFILYWYFVEIVWLLLLLLFALAF